MPRSSWNALMRTMVLPATVAAIADDLGKDARRTLYKALVVRFVPFVGWTYFVTLAAGDDLLQPRHHRAGSALAPGRTGRPRARGK